jgi:hypothetical protein
MGMKTAARRTAVTAIMSEYVMWGGPIVTRAEAARDCQLRGFSHGMLDYTVFSRPAVEAPEDPEMHSDFLRRIQVADGLVPA